MRHLLIIFFSNIDEFDYENYDLIDDLSDHFPLYLKLNCHKNGKLSNDSNIKYRVMNYNILHNLNIALSNYDWNIIDNMSIDNAYEFLIDKIIEYLDLFAPEKVKIFNNRLVTKNVWMSSGLITSLKQKNQIISKSKRKRKMLITILAVCTEIAIIN